MTRAASSLFALLAVAACAWAEGPVAGDGPTLAGCPVFPPDHVWNVRVDALPRDPASDAFVAPIGADAVVHPGFGAGLWEGRAIGVPFDVVGPDQAAFAVEFYYAVESDPGPYPIPPDAFVEGAPAAGVPVPPGGDRHVLVLETDGCILYELFDAELQGDGSWSAGSGAGAQEVGWRVRDASLTDAITRAPHVAARGARSRHGPRLRPDRHAEGRSTGAEKEGQGCPRSSEAGPRRSATPRPGASPRWSE